MTRLTCTICTKAIYSTCIRCNAAFCAEHVQAASKRCTDCEIGYDKRKSEMRPFVALLQLFTVLGFVYYWSWEIGEVYYRGGTAGGVNHTLLCLFGALVTGKLISGGLRALQRKHFLAERPTDDLPKRNLPTAVVVTEN